MENQKQYLGTFETPEKTLAEKLKNTKAYIFDWDGVFNNGFKQGLNGSGFSEIDSMGTNLLRFSHYLKTAQLPLSAIISGEKNDSAQFFAEREHFDFSFYKIANKIDALNFICEQKNIKPENIVYFFDDVLDLSIAQVCGIRILINKPATSLFANYCKQNNLVDYITACDGANHGVREACEMLMGLNQNFNEVLLARTNFNQDYQNYLNKRNDVPTSIYTKNSTNAIVRS